MKKSIKKGLGFGLTSGIITTLGLIVGLYSGTKSTGIIIEGIIIIAVADALSDALGIHISEETDSKNSCRGIWEATISTLCSKFVFAMTFIVPFVFLDLISAVIVSIFWGLVLISGFSYYLANKNRENAGKVILEHLVITVFVVMATYFVGEFVSSLFG